MAQRKKRLTQREKARKNIAASVASDKAFAQAIRAANVYREKLGYELLGPDGNPEPREEV